MAGYLGAQPVPQATEVRNTYTATASQTSFATSGYTPNFVSVYLNGVHLAPADYTATNGSDVVLASGAAVNDTVEVVAFGTFERDSGTFTGNVTVAGNIDVDGTTNLDVVDIDGAVQLDATGGVNCSRRQANIGVYCCHQHGCGTQHTRRIKPRVHSVRKCQCSNNGTNQRCRRYCADLRWH